MEDQKYDKDFEEAMPDSGYFPCHIAWFRDPRYIKIKMRHGSNGAIIFVELLVHLRERPGYQEFASNIDAIAFEKNWNVDVLTSVIRDFGVFAEADGKFYSPWLDAALRPLDAKRDRQREAAQHTNAKRNAKRKGSEPPTEPVSEQVASRLVDASKEEYSKENDSKKEDTKKHDNTVTEEFDLFWDAYGKKVDRPKAEKAWKSLTDVERAKVVDHVPAYVESSPDKKFRKDPATYLRAKSFNNEIIENAGNGQNAAAGGTSTNRTIAIEKWGKAPNGTSAARMAAAEAF